MKVKKVWKYATGEIIPKDAIYLSTQVETITESLGGNGQWSTSHTTKNILVWHYFLVEVEES